jgi:hypothetical protein
MKFLILSALSSHHQLLQTRTTNREHTILPLLCNVSSQNSDMETPDKKWNLLGT